MFFGMMIGICRPQLDKLEKWVLEHRNELTQGPYVADIGFMVSEDASGGGAVLSHEAMSVFSQVRLSIYFSEYVGHSGVDTPGD